MPRSFQDWFKTFHSSMANYSYYVDFEKVYKNVDEIKTELNILNSLIGEKDIEIKFEEILEKYPCVLKCIPILLAVRGYEIPVFEDSDGFSVFNFSSFSPADIEKYKLFMRKSGLFDLLQRRLIHSTVDYVTGVETGLDSNGRKNRGGHLMENFIEDYIQRAGFEKNVSYFKEMYISDIQSRWGLDLSAISNQGKTEKRFDFVIKTPSMVYAIETNFYGSGGSKLNETARSYKTLALEFRKVLGAKFVWFTDGEGWRSARHNLEETFDELDDVYNICDVKNGIMSKIFI